MVSDELSRRARCRARAEDGRRARSRARAEYEAARWSRALVMAALALGLAACGDDGDDESRSTGPIEVAPDGGGASSDGGAAGSSSLQIKVEQGDVEGTLVESIRVFRGIPYGKPPVGALRFAPPEPADKWSATLQAKDFGPSCVQPASALGATNTLDENCLSLNVYAPNGAKDLPVMVFIYGGAFVNGGSSQYDGMKLASTGPVVLVTFNYRLGALGFLSHPALDALRGGEPSGNDGLRDQQLALAWVQKNIAAFGGDPKNVTLFGESAGSMSAVMQLVSPRAKGLAQRHIFESGAGLGGTIGSDKAKADALGAELVAELCAGQTDVVGCLRGLPAAMISEWRKDRGITGAGWGPTFNAADQVLPAAPASLLQSGSFNEGALIVGTNKNEWGLFASLGATAATVATVSDLNAQIEKQFTVPALQTAVKQHYAASATDATANEVFIRLMTDAVFRCPSRTLVRLSTQHGRKAYLYSFEQGRAWHAYEIPYVFGNPVEALGAGTLVEPLREHMQGYWTQFAKAGDPNGGARPMWPAYQTASDQHLILQMSSAMGSGLATADCDFWDQATASQGS